MSFWFIKWRYHEKLQKITASLLAIEFILGVTGCEEKDEAVIKIDATVSPHAQVVEATANEAANQGINIELVEFSDFIPPNAALDDGMTLRPKIGIQMITTQLYYKNSN